VSRARRGGGPLKRGISFPDRAREPAMADSDAVGRRSSVSVATDLKFSTEWAAQVIDSPQVLDFFVKKYYARFDSSGSGKLAWSEVLGLSRTLGENLGVTLEEDTVASHYSQADVRKDGVLSTQEFKVFFQNMLRTYIAEAPIQPRSAASDAGSRRTLRDDPCAAQQLMQSNDWLRLLLENPAMRSFVCKQWFDRYDRNANGHMEWEETKELATRLAEELRIPSFDANALMVLFSQADRSRSGYISHEEFEKFFGKALTKALELRGAPTGAENKFEQLKFRFPEVPENVLQNILQECDGHAGHAAKLLRKKGY